METDCSVKISVSVLCYLCVYISLGDAALATIRVLKMGCYCSQSPVLPIAQNGGGWGWPGDPIPLPTAKIERLEASNRTTRWKPDQLTPEALRFVKNLGWTRGQNPGIADS